MLLLDGRPLQSRSSLRGIGTYTRGLISGLVELGEAGEIGLLLARGAADPPEVRLDGVRPARERIPLLHPTLQPVADPFLIARALRQIRPELYHGVEFGQPVVARVPVVVTVHDLIPFLYRRDYPWVRRARALARRLLSRADRVIAISQATARDVERLTRVQPSRLVVVPEGVAPMFAPAAASAIAAVSQRLGITRPYLLGVGAFDPRKRIQLLADVVRRVRSRHDVELVIVGEQGNFLWPVRGALAAAGLAAYSRLAGHVSAEDLVALYTGTSCLVFTSAYEGFGLPPLEAMACGSPAAVFANSSLAEIAGPASVVQPDGDAAAMTDAVCAILEDDSGRARRALAGREWSAKFTWQRTAQLTLDVYRQAMRR